MNQFSQAPYRGLIPFDDSDAQFFFGRETVRDHIIDNMKAFPLTLFYGASGVGKSSVLNAGVVPLGSSWILLAGLVIVGVAIFQFYLAVSRRFAVDLQLERMSQRVRRMTFACGIAGHAGRGVAFLLSGAFLIYIGLFVEVAEAGRFGNTVNTIEARPPGAWMFFAAAAGLTAYGLYLLFAAWYLRLIATW